MKFQPFREFSHGSNTDTRRIVRKFPSSRAPRAFLANLLSRFGPKTRTFSYGERQPEIHVGERQDVSPTCVFAFTSGLRPDARPAVHCTRSPQMATEVSGIDTIFCAAIGISDAGERAAFIADACGDDARIAGPRAEAGRRPLPGRQFHGNADLRADPDPRCIDARRARHDDRAVQAARTNRRGRLRAGVPGRAVAAVAAASGASKSSSRAWTAGR